VHDCHTSGYEKAYLRHTGNKMFSYAEAAKFISQIRSKIEFIGAVRGKDDATYKDFRRKFLEAGY
jgi:hypothetical protein